MAGVSLTPGRISRAKARIGGKAAFRLSSAGFACSSTSGSRWIVCWRLSDSAANAATVRLKFVTKSLSCASLAESSSETLALSDMTSSERSCSSVPSAASFTIAMPRRASGAVSSESFSDSAAVWPWVIGSWSASSPGSGSPLSASP